MDPTTSEPPPTAPPPAAAASAPADAKEPERPNKGKTAGLGVAVGYGYQFAGAGGSLQWVGGGDRGGGTLYAGGGYFPSPYGGGVPGFSGGYMRYFGSNHRLVIDANIGLAAYEEESESFYDDSSGNVTRTTTSNRTIYGFTFGAGYEWVSRGGFFLLPLGGVTFAFQETLLGSVLPTFSLGLGFKG